MIDYFSFFDGLDVVARILNAYALFNPEIGYHGGLSYLAAALVMHMPEEHAFWTFVVLLDDYLKNYFEPNMIGMFADIQSFFFISSSQTISLLSRYSNFCSIFVCCLP